MASDLYWERYNVMETEINKTEKTDVGAPLAAPSEAVPEENALEPLIALANGLFDTDRLRRHIESAYTNMWEIWQSGERPRSFSVEPIVISLRLPPPPEESSISLSKRFARRG